MKLISKLFVLMIFASVYFLVREEPKAYFDFDSYDLSGSFRKIIPEAESVEKKNYLSSWSKIYDSKGKLTGKFILSSPFCDDIKGYGGGFKIALLANTEEKVIGIVLLQHRETLSWISGLENIGFFNSWNGKTITELTDHEVDAVTGATYTSRAVRNIISKRAAVFTGAREFIPANDKIEISLAESIYDVVLYFILFLSVITIFVKKLNKFRIYLQLSSIIFFGIISGKFISIYFLENLAVNGISIFTSWITITLFVLSVIIPLVLSKHFYCHYICPFGAVQTVLGKIPVKKVRIPVPVINSLRYLRLIIFFALLAAMIFSAGIDMTAVEPFTIFIFSSASIITITGSIIIFIISVFIKTPWCTYFCPTGQFFDLLKNGLHKNKKKNMS